MFVRRSQWTTMCAILSKTQKLSRSCIASANVCMLNVKLWKLFYLF